MKTTFNILNTVFLSVGVVLGAGFVSGGELVGFFGISSFLPFVFLSGILFFITLLLVYQIGQKHGGLEGLSKLFPEKECKLFHHAMLVSTFILFSGMLAGLDSIWNSFFPNFKLPILSLLTLVLVNFVTARGIKCLEKINLILVPIIIVVVNVLVFKEGKFDFSIDELESSQCVKSVFKSLLYVTMNVFVSFPVLCNTAIGKSKKQNTISALLVAIILLMESLLILGAISYSGKNAENSDMPLFIAVKSQTGWLVFSVALLFAILTSIISSYYPLYLEGKKKNSRLTIVILCVGAFLLSRLGLKSITDNLYPVIGAFGVVFLIRCLSIITGESYAKRKKHKKISMFKRKEKPNA